jgi:multidrug efflux pump subunit AcrB
MEHGHAPGGLEGGFTADAGHPRFTNARCAWRCGIPLAHLLACGAVLASSVLIYQQLESDFLPEFDEGGFIIDFWSPPGTSLTETARQLNEAEEILSANPDVESYSRRLGAEMGMFITEPYRGDFAVKLKAGRQHSTDEVIADLRHTFNRAIPGVRWEFPGILTDVIGDLQLTPNPVEIKLFSPDLKWLKQTAPRVEEQIKKIPGVVDTFDGLTETGPSINFRVRPADAARFGLSVQDIAEAVNTALLGQIASSVLEGDRVVNIRVLADPASVNRVAALRELPLRTASGAVVRLRRWPT